MKDNKVLVQLKKISRIDEIKASELSDFKKLFPNVPPIPDKD